MKVSKGGGVRSDESEGDGVRFDIKARGEVEVRVRKRFRVPPTERLDVVVSKGVWNCGEEWVNKTFRVLPTE